MSTGIPLKPSASKKERDRDRGKRGKVHTSGTIERLKTVVRRLPPNLPEDVFWQSVQPWVTDDTTTWKVYYSGKLRKRLNKENIPSRAYIAFKDEGQLALFSQEYDGHLFRDKAGNESQAVVEFAPYQKVPAEKKKPDTRNATIEEDEDYISFLASLNAASAPPEPVSLETLIAATQPPPAPKTTPLLEALKAEKSANKDKEAILRNHAHYKDGQVISTTKKDDANSKKKVSSQSQRPAETTQGPGASGKRTPKKSSQPSSSATSPKQAVLPLSKNAGPSGSNANPTTKPSQSSKTPRPPRKPQGSVGNQIQNIVTPEASTSIPGTASTLPTPSSPAPRRGRPMIGFASRQFEAALSGAGVVGDRKPRREREKEKDKDEPTGTTAGPSTVEPKKERAGRRKDDKPGSAGSVEVKVPSILQRIDNPTSAGNAARIDAVPAPPESTGTGSDRGRGSGRRGRPKRGGNPGGGPSRGG